MVETINIYKNYAFYTQEHNAFMMIVVRSYPGITVKAEDTEQLCVEVTAEAAKFLQHMDDCDMIAIVRS